MESIGDTVYYIFDYEIVECINCVFSIDCNGIMWIALTCDEHIFPYREPMPGIDTDPTDWCIHKGEKTEGKGVFMSYSTKKTTDLEAIKGIALEFLHMKIEPTDIPFIVAHSIFDSPFILLPGKNELVNILEDENTYNEAIKWYENRVNKAESVYKLYYMVRKAYALAFVKFTEPYLSLEDFSALLADAWTGSENPNQDKNVPLAQVTRMFKKADKSTLMTEEEYKVYNNLSETFTVYRGVAKGRNPKGMSWTQSLKIAKWFSNRFGSGGFIQQATAKKRDVLAYFNGIGEDEIVINPKLLNDIHIIKEK